MSYAGLYDSSDPTDRPNYQPRGTESQRTCRFKRCRNKVPFSTTRERWHHEQDAHDPSIGEYRRGTPDEERP